MKTVVIYARYSDSKQREESIEGQLKICHKYCDDKGYIVLREYVDRAQSGKTDNRIQFRKMIEDAKKKQFEAVVVYTVDRFGRNLYQSVANEHKLQGYGVSLLSATENFSDDPSGILHRNIMMTCAQFYSDELSQKVTRGMDINAEKCLCNGGVTPFGYKVKDGKYVIDEKNAPIVKEIFEMYASGMRIKEICKILNDRQLKNAKGEPFNKNSFNTLLKNRKYMGIYVYKKSEIKGGMPQIIDEELFNKVAEIMEMNRKAPGRGRAKAEYLLTTKLFCGHCKKMMVGHSSNKISKGGIIYNYYKCKNSGGTKPCKKKMIMKDYIEDIVVDECIKVLTPINIKKIATEIARISKSYGESAEIKRLEKLMSVKQTEKNNVLTSIRACSDDELREMIFNELRTISDEIISIETSLAKERMRHRVITEDEIIQHLNKLVNGNKKDIVYRKTLIKVLINKIFLYDDKMTITFNSGSEDVTITDIMLSKIENTLNGSNNEVCLLNDEVYQNR